MTISPARPLADPHGSRQLLEALYLELTAELEEAVAAAVAVGADRAGEDQIDAGSRTSQQEQQYSLVASIRARREQVEAALRRHAEGRYGLCTGCGEGIAAERLEAFPFATECVDCRRAGERR
jgi:DnaK suppressor protein